MSGVIVSSAIVVRSLDFTVRAQLSQPRRKIARVSTTEGFMCVCVCVIFERATIVVGRRSRNWIRQFSRKP